MKLERREAIAGVRDFCYNVRMRPKHCGGTGTPDERLRLVLAGIIALGVFPAAERRARLHRGVSR
jgi:hypothetical protein